MSFNGHAQGRRSDEAARDAAHGQLIINCNELAEVTSEDLTSGTIARMQRLLAMAQANFNTIVSTSGGAAVFQ